MIGIDRFSLFGLSRTEQMLNPIEFFQANILGRGFESLKTESGRISQYIHQVHGVNSLFRN
jgi:hypothetical protein